MTARVLDSLMSHVAHLVLFGQASCFPFIRMAAASLVLQGGA